MDKKKILIIEDEQDMARLLVISLKSLNYGIVVATDGTQGVQLAHNERPDLIILDLMLPAGDGLSVLENIRLSLYLRYIPVIILTGMKNEEYKRKVIEKGVDAYFEKPYESNELLDAIKKLLQNKEGE